MQAPNMCQEYLWLDPFRLLCCFGLEVTWEDVVGIMHPKCPVKTDPLRSKRTLWK